MSLVVAKKDSPLSVIPVAAALAAGAKLVVHAEPSLRTPVSLPVPGSGIVITDPVAAAVYLAGLQGPASLPVENALIALGLAAGRGGSGAAAVAACAPLLEATAAHPVLDAVVAALLGAAPAADAGLPAGLVARVAPLLTPAPAGAVAATAAALAGASAAPAAKKAEGAAKKEGAAGAAAAAATAPAAEAKKEGGGKKEGGAAKKEGGAAPAPKKEGGVNLLKLCEFNSGAVVDGADVATMTAEVAGTLVDVFTQATWAAFPAAKEKGLVADVTPNPFPNKFIHQYQCNSTLGLAGRLKGCPGAPANPRAAAEAVMAAVNALKPAAVGHLEIAGPGYINIYLSAPYIASRVAYILSNGVRPPPLPTPRRVVVDYSSPNIAKEMHIGHLRSTIIGDTLARILEFCGHDVTRVNHVGDWGTQFGMLIAHLKDIEAASGGTVSRSSSISDLNVFYKQAKKRFDTEPEFKTRAQREVVALQAGDATNLSMWQAMVDVSAAMFNQVYARLGVDPRLALCGESFYNDKLADVVGELEAKGLTEVSEGALVVKLDGHEVPLMVRKSDGGFGYDSTDLAALKYRLQALNADWLVYVVDAGQALHFELVFGGGRKAGWYVEEGTPEAAAPPPGAKVARVAHVGFGVVQGEDKKKFKSRSGDTVRLVDVLEEARARARNGLLERRPGSVVHPAPTDVPDTAPPGATLPLVECNPPLSPEEASEFDRIAAILGYGGVKYFDLRQNRNSDYVFSYERMLSPDGDTAVYLEYAHARLCSILRKARELGVDLDAVLGSSSAPGAIAFTHASEINLSLELLKAQEVLAATTRDLLPNHVCEYVYAVANRTSEFVRDCYVLSPGTPEGVRDTRLRLVAAAAAVIKAMLGLLGIEALQKL